MVQGIFYSKTCKKPYVVPIPLRDGVQGSPTLDHLDVNYWVKQHEVDSCSCRRGHLRRSFDSVPYFPGAIDGRYTVFFERPMNSTPVNTLVRVLSRMNGCTQTFRGSVLVVKEGPSGFVNMTPNDVLLCNFLLIR
jgi:hypothetical protein